ncbi:MAG: YigZ family protein [Acidobacteriota bacterium]
MSTDHYRTIAGPVEHRQKVERSEFLGIALPISGEEQFFEELERIAKRDFDATHHCWAFRLSDGRSRSADAGEPSGTAGKPILSAIEGADFVDTGVVVVRWYGGVKLGTGGLGRAYRETAATTLAQARVVDRYRYERICVAVPFDSLGTVYRLVDPPNVLLSGERFGDVGNEFDFDVRLSMAGAFRLMLQEKRILVV